MSTGPPLIKIPTKEPEKTPEWLTKPTSEYNLGRKPAHTDADCLGGFRQHRKPGRSSGYHHGTRPVGFLQDMGASCELVNHYLAKKRGGRRVDPGHVNFFQPRKKAESGQKCRCWADFDFTSCLALREGKPLSAIQSQKPETRDQRPEKRISEYSNSRHCRFSRRFPTPTLTTTVQHK